jgi:orotate phosphoribosyltransferase-like protein
MDKIKPFERIANKFNISNETAKYFLGRVQKSFKKEKPTHILILEFIETQGIESLPEPYDIAVMLKESGIWDQALNAPPPLLMEGEEV